MQALERKNKKKNFVWNALGLTFSSFNSLFFLIIVKLVNGIDIAGIFTYAFSLGCLFFVLSIYYNRTFQVSDAKNRFSFNEYLTCRLILSIMSLIGIIIFSLISQFDFYKILVIVLIMGFKVVESISDCFYGAIQKNGELYKTGISLSIKAIGGILLFLLSDLLTHSLVIAIITLIIANILIFILYDLKNYRKISKKKITFDCRNFKSILKVCFPVFAFTALSVYLANCQKYILTYYEPNDIQTVFGILIMPATMLSLVASYLIYPAVNRLTEHHTNKRYNEYLKLALKICLGVIVFGIISLIACYFVGVPILNMLYRMDLSNYLGILMLVLVASILYTLVTIISNLLTILKENAKQSLVYLLVSILSTVVSIVLIQNYGITGAGFAFLISSLMLTVSYLIIFVFKIRTLKKELANEK